MLAKEWQSRSPYLDIFEALLLFRLVEQVLEWHMVQHYFQQGCCCQLLRILLGFGLRTCRHMSIRGIPLPVQEVSKSAAPRPAYGPYCKGKAACQEPSQNLLYMLPM